MNLGLQSRAGKMLTAYSLPAVERERDSTPENDLTDFYPRPPPEGKLSTASKFGDV